MILPCSISPWQKKSKISASRKLQLKPRVGCASLPPLCRLCCCRLQSKSWSERQRSGA
ncbi:TNNI3 isoform 6, partial [Pan troglodytes]